MTTSVALPDTHKICVTGWQSHEATVFDKPPVLAARERAAAIWPLPLGYGYREARFG